MTIHARQRLEERFNMTQEYFLKKYNKAIRDKRFFKRGQEGLNPNTISVCIPIGNRLLVVVLAKRDGAIVTIAKAKYRDYEIAREKNIL